MMMPQTSLDHVDAIRRRPPGQPHEILRNGVLNQENSIIRFVIYSLDMEFEAVSHLLSNEDDLRLTTAFRTDEIGCYD